MRTDTTRHRRFRRATTGRRSSATSRASSPSSQSRFASSRRGDSTARDSKNVVVVEPREVANVMRTLDLWWAIAGGWAIDLWLGRQTREHHDVEVVVLRDDQVRIHELAAAGWELGCIDPLGSGWRT